MASDKDKIAELEAKLAALTDTLKASVDTLTASHGATPDELAVVTPISGPGEWMDGEITCPPSGTNDGKFHLGEAVQIASSIFGKGEQAEKNARAAEIAVEIAKRVTENLGSVLCP